MPAIGDTMLFEPSHVSDEELLLSADGELPSKRASAVRRHLETCWECRTRLADLQSAIGDFIHIHHERFEASIPPSDGPRSLLKATLRQLSAIPGEPAGRRFAPRLTAPRAIMLVTAGLVIALMSVAFTTAGQQFFPGANNILVAEGAMPKASVTPGDTVFVVAKDVCTPDFPTEKQMVIPASLQQRVFAQYGISNPEPHAFEIDYLVTPDLGGASSEHNLWPEPYHNIVWNARVKDELEVHLKNLVCSGKLDIATAQHDLANNWIAAYKKYFRTPVPLGEPQPFLTLLAQTDERQAAGDLRMP
jgi:anti-sigma factor RsiW